MSLPDFHKQLIDIDYFKNNLEFAKLVIRDYEDKKEANCSWYGPRIPFYITCPKLIDNAHIAKKAIKSKNL
jgi:hypothetical protein